MTPDTQEAECPLSYAAVITATEVAQSSLREMVRASAGEIFGDCQLGFTRLGQSMVFTWSPPEPTPQPPELLEDAGHAWVEDEFNRLTGRVQTELTLIRDGANEIVVMVRPHEEVDEVTDPQEGFESSSPLRADDDADDTMGEEYDACTEIGGAEQWFRDKIRVRT